MDKTNILIIEDDEPIAKLVKRFLEEENIELVHRATAQEGLDYIAEQVPAVIILDLNLPDKNGVEVLKELTERAIPSAIIVITGHGSVGIAVEVMANGAFDFLEKPFTSDRLLVSVRNAIEHYELTGIVDQFEDINRSRFCGFIGRSPKMHAVYATVESAAPSKATVFIMGESGTGKELCAQAIHKLSPRSKGQFVAINCAAIPKDLVESEIFGHVKGAFTGAVKDRQGAVSRADLGTLFLDEIGEMDIELQAKLLRFLQSGQFQRVGSNSTETVDVRIVCATNRNPLKEVQEGRFREDLYYRLNVIPIDLPPLRDREGDVLLVARQFLEQFAKEEGKEFDHFGKEVEKLFQSYQWPGNIRELQNIVRNIVVLNSGSVVTEKMIPEQLLTGSEQIGSLSSNTESPSDERADIPTGLSNEIKPLWQVEKEAIEAAIAKCDGNIPKAAALLDVSPSTIYRKKQSWGS